MLGLREDEMGDRERIQNLKEGDTFIVYGNAPYSGEINYYSRWEVTKVGKDRLTAKNGDTEKCVFSRTTGRSFKTAGYTQRSEIQFDDDLSILKRYKAYYLRKRMEKLARAITDRIEHINTNDMIKEFDTFKAFSRELELTYESLLRVVQKDKGVENEQ